MPRIFAIALAYTVGALLIHLCATLTAVLWACCIGCLCFVVAKGWTRYLACIGFGILWATVYAQYQLEKRPDRHFLYQPVTAVGVVNSIPVVRTTHTQFEFRLDRLTSGTVTSDSRSNVRLRWYGDRPFLEPGQKWQLQIKLKPVRGYRNVGTHDRELMYFRNQIQATGYVYKAIPLLIGKDESENIVLSLRNRLRLKIQDASVEESALGIILALAIGERSGISAQQWKIFRMSGIGHLMAISGLHIGLASLFGCLIIRLLWRVGLLSGGRIPRPHLVSAGGLLFGFVYAALAGFPLPAVRALTMLSTYTVIGVLANRMYRPEVFLGLAMLTVGILNPIDVSSAGFWLSFVAVWVIFRAQKMYRKNYSTESHRPFGNRSARYVVRDYVFTLCVIQLALFVGLLPVQALYFGNLSLVSPIINLVYVPVFGLLVVPMILSGCFGLLFIGESIGGGLLSASGWLITWLLEPLNLLNQFSFSTLDLSASNQLLLVVGVLVVTILYVRKLRIFLIGTMTVILLAGSTLTSDLRNHEVRMRVFDIGQGLAILIQTRDHAMLFDAGPSFGQFSTGERVLLPALRRYGVTRLDRIIVSHVAADHAGGLDAILLNMVVDDVLSGEPERLEGSRGCRSGESWFWNEVEFRILWPIGDARLTSNDRSCVVQVITGGGRILLTGDIEVKAEQALVRDYGTELESSVLVVPHHGSNTSSTLSFLSTVRAKIAVVSAGSHNRYGHPSSEVVDRYRRLGIRLLNTAQHGEIIIKSGNRKDTVRTWARHHRRFWHS